MIAAQSEEDEKMAKVDALRAALNDIEEKVTKFELTLNMIERYILLLIK